MKTMKVLFFAVLLTGLAYSCTGQSTGSSAETIAADSGKVEVFYFHYSRRCATCNAVEKVAREAIADLYGTQVAFTACNLDEAAGQAKGEALEVAGQTLLIVASNKKIDITNEGFMNARSNPDKLKAVIKEKIDPLL